MPSCLPLFFRELYGGSPALHSSQTSWFTLKFLNAKSETVLISTAHGSLIPSMAAPVSRILSNVARGCVFFELQHVGL